MDAKTILKQQIELIKPDEGTIKKIDIISKKFCNELKKSIKNKKIKAKVFIGGSLAKNTIVKTDDDKYDVDIFVRFEKNYKDDEISRLLEKIIGNKAQKVHGSRDYYQIKMDNIILELIPVIRIKKPEEALNVTDLSYFHVNYVTDEIKKSKRLADEIKLAKAFANAQECYGAESYIRGFSGYSLELLVCHYKSFLKFIEAISKFEGKEKLIIDDGKFYKKNRVLIELNESKLISPIILVDPTFKERNALSSLSDETFERFKKACILFLRNPSEDFFRKKSILEGFKDFKHLRILSITTNKQKGDISGTKSKKFFKFFTYRLKKEFEVKKADFDYDENENIAHYYLILDKKAEEVVKGPPVNDINHLTDFKKVHPDAFIKNHISYAKITHGLSFEDFLKRFMEKDKRVIKEMSMKEIKLVQ
ncbi:MAG: hypothetical protein WC979_06460 [Candidatus Pacearchaeota archaeon]|jgi:tRNA nucleotidyltransferase (CCA-adding enzyme)